MRAKDPDFHAAPIPRREALRRLAALAAVPYAAPLLAGAAQPATSPTPPNILLISVDTLRASHMSLHGYGRPTTPWIDRIAAQGACFEHAYSVSSWTGAAHASLFTGAYPPTHQLDTAEMKLRKGWQTIGSSLQEQGYHTRAIVSGPMVESRLGLHQGFEHFDESTYKTTPDYDALRKEVNFPGITEETAIEEILLYKTKNAGTVRQAAQTFLENAPSSPWFLFLHFWDVHADYAPPARFDIFDSQYRGSLTGNIKSPDIHAQMAPRDLMRFKSLYDGEILWTDSQIGLLMEHLAQSRFGRNTCVVLISDHGEEFFEFGNKGHGHNLHDILIRVPLVFWWPGKIARGARISHPVSLVDIAPTLLEIAGGQSPMQFQGRSLLPILRNRPRDVKAAPLFASLFFRGRSEICEVQYPLKIIQDADSGELHLYNLQIDPRETTDIAPRFLSLAQRRNDDLKRWWEECHALQQFLPGAEPLEKQHALPPSAS